jgi:NADPH2:quinone reductase
MERPTQQPLQPAAGEVRVRLCWLRLPDASAGAADSGAAGVIDVLGCGVPQWRLGLPVWLLACDDAAWAEAGEPPRWRVLPSASAVALPDAVPIDAAACLGPTVLAAMLAVQAEGGVAGKQVLIEEGASQFGHYACQFARLGGAAQVLARVASPLASGLALDAGAHATLHGSAHDVALHLAELTAGEGIDRVIAADAVPGLRDPEHIGAADRERALCQLHAWLERGLVRHRVAARLPLSQIAQARALQRARRDGYAAVLLSLD